MYGNLIEIVGTAPLQRNQLFYGRKVDVQDIPVQSHFPYISPGVGNARLGHPLMDGPDPHYTGRVTVPVLWDKKNQTIVSNESAEIIRMFNTAFDAHGARAGHYYPVELREKIDELNGWIYDNVNNGVYKAGFATSQEAYDEAVGNVFGSLERLEQILGQHRYLTGDRLTEADIRLWTTLIRFDPVYVTHFKCDKHRISDYLNLHGFLRDIYQMPGIAETVNFDHIRTHYFRSHKTINPTGIISIGPWQDLDEPHGRDVRFG